jgi:RimJ/RimL family protein N-acetyltransferase
MMGGSDPEKLTARVIEATSLAKLENFEVTVVVGGSSPHLESLQKTAARSGLKIEVHNNASNMAELMAAADVAVSAAGSTSWELCLMSLPALLLDVADNQSALAREMQRRGCAIHAGGRTVTAEKLAAELKSMCSSEKLRRSLARNARELVDGNGSQRVVSVLRGELVLQLRRARAEDRRLLWEWANDPEVRAASFSAGPIPWEAHVAWFEEKLGAAEERTPAGSRIFIAEDAEGAPVGQIRFDTRSDGGWEVDVSIAKPMRGRRLAGLLITLGMKLILKQDTKVRVHAFVRPANTASLKAFESAAFRRIGMDQLRGHEAVHLLYEIN